VPAEIKTLFRPVGQAELDLIRASEFRAFPPRLPDQPFLYTVTKEEKPQQIARDWNTKDENSGYAGYVLRFDARSSFLNSYKVHTVGASRHQEYWIPAADLAEFNRNVVGTIQILASYRRQPGVDATVVK
jgi:hypothetical protein